MIALAEDRQLWTVLFVILCAFMIAATWRLGNAWIELGTVRSNFWRASAKNRLDEIPMCPIGIVCDVAEDCVAARAISLPSLFAGRLE